MTDRKLTEDEVRALLSPTEQQYLARVREAESKPNKYGMADLLRDQIRAILRANPDGVPVKHICLDLGRHHSTIYNALMTMPECWIDRWSCRQGRPTAIWKIVPPHCPPPGKNK